MIQNKYIVDEYEITFYRTKEEKTGKDIITVNIHNTNYVDSNILQKMYVDFDSRKRKRKKMLNSLITRLNMYILETNDLAYLTLRPYRLKKILFRYFLIKKN